MWLYYYKQAYPQIFLTVFKKIREATLGLRMVHGLLIAVAYLVADHRL